MEHFSTNTAEADSLSVREALDDAIASKYLKNLNLSEKDLVGKKVLDIGAGTGEFARWANTHGSDVISIGLMQSEEAVQTINETHTPYVIGDAIALPFADGAFDLVVSHRAIPNVISFTGTRRIPRDAVASEAHKRRMNAVREAIRVLKPGGEIRFAPVVRNERNAPGPDRNESMETMLAELKSNDQLEVHEELLEKDHKNMGILSDTYRIVVQKKKINDPYAGLDK